MAVSWFYYLSGVGLMFPVASSGKSSRALAEEMAGFGNPKVLEEAAATTLPKLLKFFMWYFGITASLVG